MRIEEQTGFAEYGNIQNSVDYFLRYEIPQDKRILDIGTNLGSFPDQLYRRGYAHVYGIDVEHTAIAYGRTRYPAIAHNLQWYDGHVVPFENEAFDVVTMFDVIEHIPHIAEYLREVNRVLVDGGRLIFQTPNKYVNSVWSTIVFKSFEWRKYHCSLQTLPSLRALLSRSGFHAVVIDKFNVDTEFNRGCIQEYVGTIGVALLKTTRFLPLSLFPNFYGSALKGCELRTYRPLR